MQYHGKPDIFNLQSLDILYKGCWQYNYMFNFELFPSKIGNKQNG